MLWKKLTLFSTEGLTYNCTKEFDISNTVQTHSKCTNACFIKLIQITVFSVYVFLLTFPWSMTRIRSESITVCRRCAIVKRVQFLNDSRIVSWIFASEKVDYWKSLPYIAWICWLFSKGDDNKKISLTWQHLSEGAQVGCTKNTQAYIDHMIETRYNTERKHAPCVHP